MLGRLLTALVKNPGTALHCGCIASMGFAGVPWQASGRRHTSSGALAALLLLTGALLAGLWPRCLVSMWCSYSTTGQVVGLHRLW